MVYEMLHLHFRQGKVRGAEGGWFARSSDPPGYKGLLFPVSADSHHPPTFPQRRRGPKRETFLKISTCLGRLWMLSCVLCILPALKEASEKFVDRNESIAAFLKKKKRKEKDAMGWAGLGSERRGSGFWEKTEVPTWIPPEAGNTPQGSTRLVDPRPLLRNPREHRVLTQVPGVQPLPSVHLGRDADTDAIERNSNGRGTLCCGGGQGL